jgi:hypothetical protein
LLCGVTVKERFMEYIQIGEVKVSRFILGSNPFSGFSHQGAEMDLMMKRYYTTARIKETIRSAEKLGINTMIGRTDHHIMRLLLEYWDEGSSIQWFAQTCPGVGSHEMCVGRAAANGAKACHIHGGVMDHLLAQGRLEEIPQVVSMIRQRGLLAGIAGHKPQVFEWAEKNLDVDYYMCSYYDSAPRDKRAEHVSGMEERFLPDDRRVMTELIQELSKPVIHYKVLAAGRNEPEEAFAFVTRSMRESDAVCVGVYTQENPRMLEQDVELLARGLPVHG